MIMMDDKFLRKGETSEREMTFSNEPTARADQIAYYMRFWYETNRESWFDRHAIGMILTGHALGATPDRDGAHADEFMLSLISEVNRIQEIAKQKLR
jgi:hypothetical protein